jgi:hypothetical protein
MDLGLLGIGPWTVKTKVDEMIKKWFDQRRVTRGMTFVTSKTDYYSHKMSTFSTGERVLLITSTLLFSMDILLLSLLYDYIRKECYLQASPLKISPLLFFEQGCFISAERYPSTIGHAEFNRKQGLGLYC